MHIMMPNLDVSVNKQMMSTAGVRGKVKKLRINMLEIMGVIKKS